MSKPLVVVESPTKVGTLKKYLGKDFNIAATVGHIKDLPKKEMGIDIENGFKPEYQNIPGKQKVIKELKKAAGDADDVYLAPDPDREGEAIAWHAAEVLKKKGRKFYRVLFHELTKNGIQRAMATPENLHKSKYEAQQARRILDRLVGYQISPLLWRKVKGGLSAGRVQSVAVRIICEREREIQAFVPEEYWSITGHFSGETPPAFPAALKKKNNKKFEIKDGETADSVLKELKTHDPVVKSVRKKTTKRNPNPPYTTSKLQQDAIRKLRFTAKKTMIIAQQLYEGVEIGPGEPLGLITYMRTDSTRISGEAADEALQLINEQFGSDYAIDKPRMFKNKKKAQDAHEAIRPTSVYNKPEEIKSFLTADQYKLYHMIWTRFVASQMQQALIDQKTILIDAGPYQFQATGSTVKFPGFLKLYESDESATEKDKIPLPELEEKSPLKAEKYEPKQHFTMPPPRFSEASLVKELEENGIGRPSTYAAILSTIREKGYVDMEKGQYRPTELGFIVNDLIVNSFPDILDVDFTARMEDNLDRVESAEIEYQDVLSRFYEQFRKELEQAAEDMLNMKAVGFETKLDCPRCEQGKLHIKMGKNGHFLACNRYPECTYSTNYIRDEKGQIQPQEPPAPETVDKNCPKCGRGMVAKQGRYGPFLACSGYPECHYTESIGGDKEERATGIACPESGCTGELVRRTSRRGKEFYGCNRFPDCKFATWHRPVKQPCPECQAPFVLEKSTKKEGKFLTCLNEKCDFKQSVEENET